MLAGNTALPGVQSLCFRTEKCDLVSNSFGTWWARQNSRGDLLCQN